MMARRSAFSVLRALPPVFELHDVEIALDTAREYASQYCARWKKEGMIGAFANGVYFNLVVDPDAKETRIKEAVDRVVRRPVVLIGASALHAHGWTTQRAHLREIAVPVTRDVRNIRRMAGVVAEGRSIAWFNVVTPVCEPGVDGFLVPPPEYVLVDMIAARDKFQRLDKAARARLKGRTIWHADPDDVNVGSDDPEDALRRIFEAGEALGVERELLEDYVSQMDDLSDLLESKHSI